MVRFASAAGAREFLLQETDEFDLLGIGQQFATNRMIGAPVVKQVRPPAERRMKTAGAGRSEDARKA